MKEILRITISLVVIFIAAGVIMGMVYKTTSPVKFQAEKKEKEEALKEMAPEATEPITKAGDWSNHGKNYEYFRATSSGKAIAYIASTAGKGYSSYIKMLISLDTDMRVKGIKILGHGETPGLGDQIEEAPFLDQFKGKTFTQIILIKGETKENIQAISGATISSRAVTNGVRDGVQLLAEKYGSGVKPAVSEVQK